MQLEVGRGREDVQSDLVGVEHLEDGQLLPAQLGLPGQLLLVHVLDEAALRPPVHLGVGRR